MASGLSRRGVARGDRVALALDGGVDYIIAYYAVLKAMDLASIVIMLIMTLIVGNTMRPTVHVPQTLSSEKCGGLIAPIAGHDKTCHADAASSGGEGTGDRHSGGQRSQTEDSMSTARDSPEVPAPAGQRFLYWLAAAAVLPNLPLCSRAGRPPKSRVHTPARSALRNVR